MKTIDEVALLTAMTEREVDAKLIKRVFKAEWLSTKAYVPVLNAIFDFMEEHKVVPSWISLHAWMQEKDKDTYENRYKTTLHELESHHADKSRQVVSVKGARARAIALSFASTLLAQGMQELVAEGEGTAILSQVSKWMYQHIDVGDDPILDIKAAIDHLIDSVPFSGRPPKIRTGIICIDDWSAGGLRAGDIGIILAPTGHGKSAILLNIAYHIALIQQMPVLFLTNELSLEQQTERFMSRMQAPEADNSFYPLHKIQEDPTYGYRGIDKKWLDQLHKRLWIGHLKINATAADIEGIMYRLKTEQGFAPVAVIIDYMGFMQPTNKSKADAEWVTVGEVAKELENLGKRTNTLVWTAAHMNRGGLRKGNIKENDMGDAQSSTRHLQSAACVIMARKVYVEMDADGKVKIECLAFKEGKQRHAAMEDRSVNLRVDLSHMFISEERVEAPTDQVTDADEMDDGQPKPKQRKIRTQKQVRYGY